MSILSLSHPYATEMSPLNVEPCATVKTLFSWFLKWRTLRFTKLMQWVSRCDVMKAGPDFVSLYRYYTDKVVHGTQD